MQWKWGLHGNRVCQLIEMREGPYDVRHLIGSDFENQRAMANEVNSILTEGLGRIRELAEGRNEELPGLNSLARSKTDLHFPFHPP